MTARSRLPLIVAGVLALGVGVGLALALREPAPEVPDIAKPARTADESRALQLRLRTTEVPVDKRGGEEFLASRWGHLGDVGLVMPGSEMDGERYFIEPKVFQAWTPKGRNYATVIGHSITLDESHRIRGKPTNPHKIQVNDFKPRGAFQRLATGYKPITNPDDAPDSLKKVFGGGQ